MADNDQNQNQPQRGPAAAPVPARRTDAPNPAAASGDDAARRSREGGRDAARARFDEEKKASLENRPQQVGEEGSRPTPTQQENDEIRSGLRHIDDKEDDGSGPDPLLGRNLRADSLRRGYETR